MSSSPQKSKGTEISRVSDETILKVSKEIAVKFIEMGRMTPSSFKDHFASIHSTIKQTVNND